MNIDGLIDLTQLIYQLKTKVKIANINMLRSRTQDPRICGENVKLQHESVCTPKREPNTYPAPEPIINHGYKAAPR